MELHELLTVTFTTGGRGLNAQAAQCRSWDS